MNATFFHLTPPPPLLPTLPKLSPLSLLPNLSSLSLKPFPKPLRTPSRIFADDGDADGGDDYDMDDDEVEEVDNKKDYELEYEPILNGDEIEMSDSKSFVFTQGWDSEMIVDYRINEEEFHKISLADCDFFIRKPPDLDNDVYDFREMYVTPPDTDIYAIPRILAPMPQKYIRCATSDYGCYNVSEPPIDAPRDPMYKSEREVSKVTVPEGRDRDRKEDLLVIRDNGNTFKIIPSSERDDPTTVIEKEEWDKTRKDMERHLRKLRDFSVSNWF
ncbi:PLASTID TRANSCRIPTIONALLY ACTIVE protein 6, chloroplastic isoform X2 [Apium graveolens]|uniref:PLASTID TRANSCRIPTIONALLY ACTIVE protein 6, chloroplastic isoform X2 n=1 Tax=Apium graveolens TaxID=4045 RepID=UPI003D791B3E